MTPQDVGSSESFVAVVRSVASRIAPDRIEVVEHNPPTSLRAGTEIEVLSIVREAIANALAHAGSRARIKVAISRSAGGIEVQVEDDGAGFDPIAESVRKGHFGLWSMRERAARIGARLDVMSREGRGTRVRLLLPIDGQPSVLSPDITAR